MRFHIKIVVIVNFNVFNCLSHYLICCRYHREGAESWTRRAHTYNRTCTYGAMKASSTSSSLSSTSPTLRPSTSTSFTSYSSWSSTSYSSPTDSSSSSSSYLSSEESSSAIASSPLILDLPPLFNNSISLSNQYSVNRINSNKFNLRKHLNDTHFDISTTHHTGLNGSRRFKCDTSHCIPHTSIHSPTHTTPHSRRNSDNKQKAGTNLNLNLNHDDITHTPVRATVLHVTRAAVVNYCK